MPDRAALVTGASSGIGLAIAEVLGEKGYGLTVAARRPEKLAGAVEELRGKGYEIEELAADLASEEDVQRVVAAHRERFGRLDVLVNTPAWGSARRRPRSRPSGATCSSTSTCGRSSSSTASAPTPARGGRRAPQRARREPLLDLRHRAPRGCRSTPPPRPRVIGWTQAMNQELSGDGIKTVALCPGFVDTPMTEFISEQVKPEDTIRTGDIAGAVRFLLDLSPPAWCRRSSSSGPAGDLTTRLIASRAA